MTISSLIDKQDNFEIIRDQIAAILVTERNSQKQLAIAAGRDPALWDFNVYTERSNPWEQYLNRSSAKPIVNIWYDSSSFDRSASNVMERQATDGVFNIDCYGYGISSNNGTTGHNPGDREAAYEVQRTLKLVRNILMAGEYTYLGLRGTVWQRWPQSINIFQPQIDAQNVQQIVAARIAFNVRFNEFAPQVVGETLEGVLIDVKRAYDGEIILETDYIYTPEGELEMDGDLEMDGGLEMLGGAL